MVFSFFGFGKKKKDKGDSKEQKGQLVRVQPRSRPAEATLVDTPAAAATSAAVHPSENLPGQHNRYGYGIASERTIRPSQVAPMPLHHRSTASVSVPAQQQQRPARKEPQRILVAPAPVVPVPAVTLAPESPAEETAVSLAVAAPEEELKLEEAEDEVIPEKEPAKKKKNPPAPRKFTFSDWDITRATGHEYHRGIGFVS